MSVIQTAEGPEEQNAAEKKLSSLLAWPPEPDIILQVLVFLVLATSLCTVGVLNTYCKNRKQLPHAVAIFPFYHIINPSEFLLHNFPAPLRIYVYILYGT